MHKKYKVSGMTCNGCRTKVEDTLNQIDHVKAQVNLELHQIDLELTKEIDTLTLQKQLFKKGPYVLQEIVQAKDGSQELLDPVSVDPEDMHETEIPTSMQDKAGKYFCPMLCEGNKTYDSNVGCPVCGMNLEQIPAAKQEKTVYYCPMLCEGDKTYDKAQDCPICGMPLVAKTVLIQPQDTTYRDMLNKLWISIGFTLPVFILAMGPMIPNNPITSWIPFSVNNYLQFLFTLPVIWACWMFFHRAWISFKTWNLNMFSLIGLGAGAAMIFSIVALFFPNLFPESFQSEHGIHLYFESVAVILTLVLVGQVMEARAHSKTSSAIKSLLELSPSTARKLTHDAQEIQISIQDIKVGDKLVVKPGDKIPVDGQILEGQSHINESMITGEPISVFKNVSDKVIGATLNEDGSFVMEAQKIGSQTLLSQIIDMVNNASRSRAPIQNLADKVSKYFVPIVVMVAILTFIIWFVFSPTDKLSYAIINSLAVLIIACPCALGLATPMSIMVGIGKGAQNGILIKDAQSLEIANKVNVLITDKTGTLTMGRPSVEFIKSVHIDYTDEQLLYLSGSLNQNSEHPLSKAFTDKAKEQSIELTQVKLFKNTPGKGIQAVVDKQRVSLGNQALMQSIQIEIPESIIQEVEKYQAQGKTVSFLAVDQTLLGYAVIYDPIKESSLKAVEDLQKKSIQVIMVTGDNPLTAKAVADQLGIKNYIAKAMPQDKLDIITKLQQEGKIVAMAGDGINDAPALAKADVGISMGTGTDVAIESAKITLLKGDLSGIPKAINLSHKVMVNIKQNLFFAFIYNTIGIPIAAGVLFPIFGIVLSPMIAALAMSFSSVSVISNSLRLKNIKL
ncbi:heavy metal translocating P-type ATPase [Myroides sp. LJL119]